MIKFKTGESRKQGILFPKRIEDYLPEGHLAKIVVAIVEGLTIGKIINKYSERGQHAFDPTLLIAILFYGYSIGIRSSRKLAKACEERVDFMYIAAGLTPSHKTISEFRKENLEEIKGFFQEIILIGVKLGIVQMGSIKISTDGSKIRANASGKVSKDEEGLKKLLDEVNEKIATILKEAEAIDNKEDGEYGENRGDEIPEDMRRQEGRKAKIEGAIEELRKEKERLREELHTSKGKVTKKEEKKIQGKKINLTDPDAQYMKEREGCIKTNYNTQLCVEEAHQFILASDVTDEANDKKQLIPMLKQTEENIGEKPVEAKADSGYHSAQNLADAHQMGIDTYIDDPYKQRVGNKNHSYDKVSFLYDAQTDSYICPEGKRLELKSTKGEKSTYKCKECPFCPAKGKCTTAKSRIIIRDKNEQFVEANREKILSEEGKKKYQKRMHTVEPVFGNIKFNLGFRQFLLRGLKKVKGEFNLMCIAHNLKKIAKYGIENNMDLNLCSEY